MSKDVTKETSKETIKETVKETPKEMPKEPIKEEKKDQYDENLEGYYSVNHPAVNLRSIPNGKKPDSVVCLLLNGMKVECKGYYTMAGSVKFLKVNNSGKTGYVSENYLTKL